MYTWGFMFLLLGGQFVDSFAVRGPAVRPTHNLVHEFGGALVEEVAGAHHGAEAHASHSAADADGEVLRDVVHPALALESHPDLLKGGMGEGRI